MSKSNGDFFSQKVGFLFFNDGSEFRPMTAAELECVQNELLRRVRAVIAEADQDEGGDGGEEK